MQIECLKDWKNTQPVPLNDLFLEILFSLWLWVLQKEHNCFSFTEYWQNKSVTAKCNSLRQWCISDGLLFLRKTQRQYRQHLIAHSLSFKLPFTPYCLFSLQVVMAVAQLYFHLAPKAEVGVIAKALVRLLRSHRWALLAIIWNNLCTQIAIL